MHDGSNNRESGTWRARPRRTRASVLIIVMVTLLFAVTALIAFMDKATNDLLVDHREALDRRLRQEAYSALEVTLAVLNEFQMANSGLHSPAEGWSDPLAFAAYIPAEERTIEVTFEDESGKISLPHANADVLTKLFQSWEISEGDADMLTDALLGWMKKDHVYTTAVSPDYEMSAIPFLPPERPLRSYSELAAIDKVRDMFYEKGLPNDYWRRFVASVSLFDFAKTNINGGNTDVLTAVGQYDPTQLREATDYLAGRGQYQTQGPGYFKDVNQAAALVGQGNTAAFSTTITALRINLTVHEGRSQFRISTVIAPRQGGARIVQQTATSQRAQASGSSAQTSEQRQAAPNTQENAATARGGQTQSQSQNAQNLQYPFTLLEIRENAEIAPIASPPPAAGTL